MEKKARGVGEEMHTNTPRIRIKISIAEHVNGEAGGNDVWAKEE